LLTVVVERIRKYAAPRVVDSTLKRIGKGAEIFGD
jgi:rRNA processing protein Gar1